MERKDGKPNGEGSEKLNTTHAPSEAGELGHIQQGSRAWPERNCWGYWKEMKAMQEQKGNEK